MDGEFIMHHKILDALANITTPERMVIYKESVSILLLKDLSIYDLIFDNFHDSMFESDTVSNLADFDNLLIGNLRGTIEEFGIYLAMDVVDARSVEPMTYLAKMLYDYDRYDDQNELLLMLEQEVPATELIGEMVASITSYNKVEAVMEIISDVSTAIIKKMRLTSQETIKAMELEPTYSQEELERIAYLAKLSDKFQTRAAYDMLAQGWKFGDDLGKYALALVPADEVKEPSHVAALLCLAAVMANTPIKKIKEVVGEYVQSRFDDKADLMMGIGRALNRIDLEVV